MNNYQLYRTNIKLGGQVAWNLVLDGTSTDLRVNYFDVTPISPYVNYNYGQNTECVKYTHAENLRTLYKETKGQFYETCINPQLNTIYPVLDDTDINTHDTNPEMGCSRISYSRYRKQLQILCPVWLEDFGVEDELSFELSLYPASTPEAEFISDNKLSSKRLYLKNYNIGTYHNQFVNYFKQYIQTVSTNGIIGDDVLNVDVTNKFASVTGLDIKTGELVSKDISDLVPNLFDRERPLMETDFMLIDNFHTSEIVAKQLFNFNLVFDISDIATNTMNNMLGDNEFSVCVDVYKNDEQLEKRTFNNNYSSLETSDVEFGDVLKYLQDDKCIDIIRDNKLTPEICHWTLNDNDKYIFNLYPGFATSEPMFYGKSPNYWETDVKEHPNALQWIEYYDRTSGDIDVVLDDVVTGITYTEFNPKNSFVGDSRVDTSLNGGTYTSEYLASFEISDSDNVVDIKHKMRQHDMNYYVIMILNPYYNPESVSNSNMFKFYASDQLRRDRLSDYDVIPDEITGRYMMLVFTDIDNYYVLVSNKSSHDLLSFKYASRALEELQLIGRCSDVMDSVKKSIQAFVSPKFIRLYNTLNITKADSPWVNTNEIYYLKNNNEGVTVVRYDGKIKPMFSTFSNTFLYRVRKMSAAEFSTNTSFLKSQTQGFLPNYPSTGYFNLEVFSSQDIYDTGTDTYDDVYKNEYKWFDHGIVYNLVPIITGRLHSKTLDHYYSNDELIDWIIVNTYPNLSANHKEYLRSLYQAEISYEYDDPIWDKQEERFDYVYTINLRLK